MRELFSKEALAIEYGAYSWEEAIRVTGKLMLERGSIEEGYIQAMIDVVHKVGPYIVLAPHIAIAHAAAGTYVQKDDLVVVVFKEPVLFHCDNDPVHLMIGLCAIAKASHLELLKNLSLVLDDENVWKEFLACENLEQLYARVNKQI